MAKKNNNLKAKKVTNIITVPRAKKSIRRSARLKKGRKTKAIQKDAFVLIKQSKQIKQKLKSKINKEKEASKPNKAQVKKMGLKTNPKRKDTKPKNRLSGLK